VQRRPAGIMMTGIVTTDEVIVSSEIQGRLQQLFVREGDTVTNGQLLGVIQPETQQADMAFYASSERQATAQVAQAGADLKFEEAQTSNQIAQAEANLASAQAQVAQAAADLENAQLTFQREEKLKLSGAESEQAYDQARTAYDSAKARSESLRQQVEAAKAAVDMAKSTAQQVAARHAALEASNLRPPAPKRTKPRCSSATRKSGRRSTGWWTRAPRCKAKSLIPGRPL
jgi:HlyD family secretion protein